LKLFYLTRSGAEVGTPEALAATKKTFNIQQKMNTETMAEPFIVRDSTGKDNSSIAGR